MSAPGASPPAAEPAKASTIFVYFGSLTLLVYLASPVGYLLDIASSYMLKNQLHASAEEVAKCRSLDKRGACQGV